jgi:hypothetical protein
MKPVSAQMQWKGRKLLCNGVCVAVINFWTEDCKWRGVKMDVPHLGPYCQADTARRAINARFKLPLDFGDQ